MNICMDNTADVVEMVDCREAKRRSTSIYLPTGAIPMFPMELASTVMSLRQGYEACAVSVSIIFHPTGR